MKFKVFVCVALTLIVLLQATIVSMFIYGATKIKNASSEVQSSVTDKTEKLTESTININKSLTSITEQIKTLNDNLSGRYPSY